MDVKERLKRFVKFKKMSIRAFCEIIGVSSAYISSMRVSIQPDKVDSIAIHFPDLNIEWLLTGNGNMLKDADTNKTNLLNSSNLPDISSVEDLREQSTIKERIDQLVSVLEMSARQFSFSIGKSETFVRTIKNNISADVIGNILQTYPSVNPYWLILGIGSMFLDKKDNTLHNDTSNLPTATEIHPLVDLIKEQQSTILKLTEENIELKHQLKSARYDKKLYDSTSNATTVAKKSLECESKENDKNVSQTQDTNS